MQWLKHRNVTLKLLLGSILKIITLWTNYTLSFFRHLYKIWVCFFHCLDINNFGRYMKKRIIYGRFQIFDLYITYARIPLQRSHGCRNTRSTVTRRVIVERSRVSHNTRGEYVLWKQSYVTKTSNYQTWLKPFSH